MSNKGNAEYPTDPQAKKAFITNIVEAVDSKLREASEKELQATIAETVLEKHEVDKGFFKKQVDMLFDLKYNEGKKAETIRANEEMLSVAEIELAAKI